MVGKADGRGRRCHGATQVTNMPFTLEKQKFIRRSRAGRHSFLSGRRHRFCNRLAVNDKGNDRGDHFRDPKRMPDADGAEKPAEAKRNR